MPMSPHPSKKPSPPRKPPEASNPSPRKPKNAYNEYGANMGVKVHGVGGHDSEFHTKENGAVGGFAKPGTPTKK